jgi:uncharacterized protein (TIGR02246 family)
MRWVVLALTIVLTACSRGDTASLPDPENDPLNAEIEKIRSLEADMQAAWASRDAAKIASFYATDAFIQIPGQPVIDQIDAIRREIGKMMQDPSMALHWTPDIVEIARSGEIAWSRGSYTATFTDPATMKLMQEEGQFVNTYRKVNDGSWKIVADVPTPTGPATPIPTETKP